MQRSHARLKVVDVTSLLSPTSGDTARCTRGRDTTIHPPTMTSNKIVRTSSILSLPEMCSPIHGMIRGHCGQTAFYGNTSSTFSRYLLDTPYFMARPFFWNKGFYLAWR